MTFSEKSLYHQIHPLKLGTDVLAYVVSLCFLWQHAPAIGLTVHFLPPIIASAFVISFVDLGWLKESRFGRYVARMMTRPVEAARLFGDIAGVFGAWYHSWPVIVGGLLIIAAAWLSGFVYAPRTT